MPAFIAQESVKQIIANQVRKTNATLAPYEQIKRYQFIHAEWTVEGGEITPKQSLKHKLILQKNKLLYVSTSNPVSVTSKATDFRVL
ncbi:MAG: hypothetical protein QM530_06340 [Phycisphaerales bacterium]|nr:hypothetical protein [Phycisphaerales bacterium]